MDQLSFAAVCVVLPECLQPSLLAKQRFCHARGRLVWGQRELWGKSQHLLYICFSSSIKVRSLGEALALWTCLGGAIPALSWYKPCPNPTGSAAVAKQTHSSAAGIELEPGCGWFIFHGMGWGCDCWVLKISRTNSCPSLCLLETLQMTHFTQQSCGEQHQMSLWGSVPFLQELWLPISLSQALLEVTAQRSLNQPSFPGQSHPPGFTCQGCSREPDGIFF